LDFTIIGSEGTLRVEWDKVTLRKPRSASAADFSGLASIGNTIDQPVQVNDTEILFAEKGYNDCHLDHISRFINAIRNKTEVEADVRFAVQTAVPAVMCFESFHSGRPVYWDAEKLELKQ